MSLGLATFKSGANNEQQLIGSLEAATWRCRPCSTLHRFVVRRDWQSCTADLREAIMMTLHDGPGLIRRRHMQCNECAGRTKMTSLVAFGASWAPCETTD